MNSQLQADLSTKHSAQSYNEWITESSLRKVDSVIYHGRKVILLTACALPLVYLLSQTIVFASSTSFFVIGLVSCSTFSFLDSMEKGKLTCIEEAKERGESIPTYQKSTKSLIMLNLCNKIFGFSFPFCAGTSAALELVPMTSRPIGLALAVTSSMVLSVFFEIFRVFERDYEKQYAM